MPKNEHNREMLLHAPVQGGKVFETESEEARGASLWSVVDDRLRGRWKWMFLVGLVLAATLATVGYVIPEPLYEAEGIIHIKPEGEIIRRQTPETEAMSQYPQYVQTQASKLGSATVLQAALKEPELESKEWARLPGAVTALNRGLSVDAPRNNQLIKVTYAHVDREEARERLNAILRAYMKQSGDAGGSATSAKANILKQWRTNLNNRLVQASRNMYALDSVTRFHTPELQRELDKKVGELSEVDQELRAVQMLIARHADSDDPDRVLARPTNAQLEAIDPELSVYRRLVDNKQHQIDMLLQRMSEDHRPVVTARRELEAAVLRYEQREQAALEAFERQSASGNAAPPTTGGMGNPRDVGLAMTLNQLTGREGELIESRDRLRADINMILADLPRMQEMRVEFEDIRRELGDTQRRIYDLEVEATETNRSRITLFQEAQVPPVPARDRRKPLAMLGAVGGFGAAFALFFLLGSLDRRAYRLHQISSVSGLRSLGVLPDLGHVLRDPETAEMAAHCVHQIRNLIEATRPAAAPAAEGSRQPGVVIAISSPYQGDGKTSITLALGFSYAAAGNRTLVVDGDLVGKGLTRQLELLDAHGLKEVIREGHVNGEIVAVGNEIREETLKTNGAPLRGGSLNVLPVGLDLTIGPAGIRKSDLVRTFEQLRSEFDIVLVDTGPVLGSLECLPIAAAADGVVLTVRRGRQRSRLEDCVETLESINATCYGVVMNCAARSECSRYVSDASIDHARQAIARAERDGRTQHNGNPLVSVVSGRSAKTPSDTQ